MERVKLSKRNLEQDFENGLTRPMIAEKYGISVGQVRKALTKLGINNVRANVVKFEIVEDDYEETTAPATEETVADEFNHSYTEEVTN